MWSGKSFKIGGPWHKNNKSGLLLLVFAFNQLYWYLKTATTKSGDHWLGVVLSLLSKTPENIDFLTQLKMCKSTFLFFFYQFSSLLFNLCNMRKWALLKGNKYFILHHPVISQVNGERAAFTIASSFA